MRTSKASVQMSETQALSPDGLPRKRGRRPVRGVSAGLQLNLNSGAARHAAEQFKQWVQALGGAQEVSPQEATLLRHASYLATYTDALWYQICVSASNAGFAASELSRSAQACAALLRACGLARRCAEASAPRLRELASLASQLAAPLATNASPAAEQASPPPTPATSWPPCPARVEGTLPAETSALPPQANLASLESMSEATARSAALPGAPLAFFAENGEQPALPGLETPSEIAKRKQYLYSSDSEMGRRLRSQHAATAGSLGGYARQQAQLAKASESKE